MEFQSKEPDEIFRSLKAKFKSRGQKSFPISLVVILLAVLFLGKGVFYTIQPDEVGIVLRFGKFVRTSKPGLHFKIPLGVEKAIPVKVEKVYTDEFGFRTQSPGVRTVYSQKSYDDESLMLTGDLNVLDVEWITRFRIRDPFKALFKVRNVDKTIRDISESVMRGIVGDYTFNEVLTTKRIEINDLSRQQMQKILDFYGAGIQIVNVRLQDVNPPDPVKPAFNEVNEAKQEKEKLINQAWEVYNQKIPQANGQASKMIKEAEGYSLEKVNRARGDAQRFDLLRQEYIQAKDVTVKRLYIDHMSRILKRAGTKYIVDPKEKGILPLLNLKNEK